MYVHTVFSLPCLTVNCAKCAQQIKRLDILPTLLPSQTTHNATIHTYTQLLITDFGSIRNRFIVRQY